MGMPNRAGIYFGKPLEWVVEANRNGLPQFVVRFGLSHLLEGRDWAPVQAEIVGYFYPVKKDGTRNDVTVEMLAKVFGWDQQSFDSLQSGTYGAIECQIDIREDEWNGQRKLKVAFVNPADYSPQPLQRTEPSKILGLDQRFGAVLRGGKVAPVVTRPLPPGAAVAAAKAPAVRPPDDTPENLDIPASSIPF